MNVGRYKKPVSSVIQAFFKWVGGMQNLKISE